MREISILCGDCFRVSNVVIIPWYKKSFTCHCGREIPYSYILRLEHLQFMNSRR